MKDSYDLYARKLTAEQYRQARKMIREQEREEINNKRNVFIWVIIVISIVMLLGLVLEGCACASTVIVQPNIEGYSVNQWCEAIYKAEGGTKTHHPYGILAIYRHTNSKQACINTILHKYRDYRKLQGKTGKDGHFIDYLASKYCPVGCSNDVVTNKYWVNNVLYWLKHG